MGARGPKPFVYGDHCRRGHLLTQETVHWEVAGGIRKMRCALCRRQASVRRYAENPKYAAATRLRAKAWYWANLSRAKDRNKRYQEAHRDQHNEANRRYRSRWPERIAAYIAANKEKNDARYKAYWKAQVASLSDAYICQCVGWMKRLARELPRELLAAKRAHLKAKRTLKGMANG